MIIYLRWLKLFSSFNFFNFAEVNRLVWEERRGLHWHKLAQSEQEDQNNANKHSQSCNNTWYDPVVYVIHVPALNTERCSCHIGAVGSGNGNKQGDKEGTFH